LKRVSTLGIALLLVTSAATAQAQDGEASASLSTEGADASLTGPSDTAEGDRPLQRPFEFGIFGGVIFPPKDHSLRDWDEPYQDYDDVALDLGLRVALFPLDYIGIEGEGAIMPTQTEGGNSALLYHLRAHAILQYPFEAITPFAVIGGGRMQVNSDALGVDSDWGLHFGVGAKVPVTDHLSIRLDLRDTITTQQASPDTQHWPEILLGASLGFGGGSEPPPPPPAPADTDGDGITDDLDKCPTEAANTPDGCPIPDTDKDGKLDPEDECPQEAGTLPNGCPDLDTDKDNIPTPTDKCPNEAGIAPDGCPDLDVDKDNIPTPADKCPDQPETVNGYEDTDGCPDEVPEAVKKFTGVIKGIQFDTGKATVRAVSFPLLNDAAKVLKDYPNLRLKITGHTDSTGNAEKNMALSLARADAVKQYLVDQGIDTARLETRGAGQDEPVADNKTPAGRAENRRIEFQIVQ
jgi:OOP family OmpA-OmpF porin